MCQRFQGLICHRISLGLVFQFEVWISNEKHALSGDMVLVDVVCCGHTLLHDLLVLWWLIEDFFQGKYFRLSKV